MKYMKLFFILLLISFIIYIYWFLADRKEVETINDYLVLQNEIDNKILEDLELNNYTYNNPKVILNPYGSSPLTALIIYETKDKEEVEVTVLGKDSKTTLTNKFLATNRHFIPIYGLYPNHDNKIIIKGSNYEKEIIIKTDALPTDLALPISVFAKREVLTNDFIFVSPSSKGYMAAYDINGDVRWYLTNNYSWDIQQLANGHILIGTDRLINEPYYTTGLLEIDFIGKVYKEYRLPGGYHHDVYEMPDGNLLVASNDFSKGTAEDEIVLINRDNGEIEKSWDLSSIIPMDQSKSEDWIEHDWFHNNSVWYDSKTNSITLSGRHLDAVINITYNSGKLNWIIGDSTNWGKDMKKYFFKPIGDDFEWQWSQHAAMVIPNGDIFIFDNGNNRSKIREQYLSADKNYSRGVIYNINTSDMTIKQVWQYGKQLGRTFYSPYISDVDYLDENHYLIHSGGIANKDGKALDIPGVAIEGATLTSITKEISNNEVVLELVLSGNYYRAEKINMYNNNNFNLEASQALGTLGKTKGLSKYINTTFAAQKLPDEYNLTLKKQSDRLVLNGNFKSGSQVYLVLTGLFNNKTYQILVSKTPYTAKCLDIFNNNNIKDDRLNISFYVNEEGISGTYDIYLEIDGFLYNTKRCVKFK